MSGFATNIQPLTPSAGSCTETGKIVEDTTGGVAKRVNVYSGQDLRVFGSWAELDASLSADSWICSIGVWSANSTEDVVLELGKGSAGNEVTIVRWTVPYVMQNEGTIIFTLPIPIKVASGTRLALRAADGSATDFLYRMSVQYYQGLET